MTPQFVKKKDKIVVPTRQNPNEENAQPPGPSIVSALDPMPKAGGFLLDDMPMPHTVACDIPLPVDCVKIIVLSNAQELLFFHRVGVNSAASA